MKKTLKKTHKICVTCKNEKEYDLYYKSTRHKDGFISSCKACHNIKIENKGSNPKIKRTPAVTDFLSIYKDIIGIENDNYYILLPVGESPTLDDVSKNAVN